MDVMNIMPTIRSCRSLQAQKCNTSWECNSVHLSDELVDVVFPVTKVTTLHIVHELALSPTTSGV